MVTSTTTRQNYFNTFKQSLSGDLETFKRNLHNYSDSMIENTFESAIQNNNLECVKYIVENKLVTVTGEDKVYCDIAAQKSAFECLQYLHKKGCPFRRYTALISLIRDDIKSLHYIIQNGGELTMPQGY